MTLVLQAMAGHWNALGGQRLGVNAVTPHH